jgi:hypothetical protein
MLKDMVANNDVESVIGQSELFDVELQIVDKPPNREHPTTCALGRQKLRWVNRARTDVQLFTRAADRRQLIGDKLGGRENAVRLAEKPLITANISPIP